MISIIVLFINVSLAAVELFLARKYRDRIFLYISFAGIVLAFINLLTYTGYIHYLLTFLSFPCYLFIIFWYSWKKFQEKTYYRLSILSLVAFLLIIYGLFLDKETFSLPIGEWSLPHLVFLIGMLAIIVAFFVV